jgi:hypothetical protein
MTQKMSSVLFEVTRKKDELTDNSLIKGSGLVYNLTMKFRDFTSNEDSILDDSREALDTGE